MKYKISKYTHFIPFQNKTVLHNSKSGAIATVSESVARDIRSRISEDKLYAIKSGCSIDRDLEFGGFIVDYSIDETAMLSEAYEYYRNRFDLILTIIPTFNCNLNCNYCFVGKKKGSMSDSICKAVVEFINKQLDKRAFPAVRIDWLGGEPILKLEVIKSVNSVVRDICNGKETKFFSSVITNGTLLTEKNILTLVDIGVQSLQITLDGPKILHDKRRSFKLGKGSSFETIISGITRVAGRIPIRLRINVDMNNSEGVLELLEFLNANGFVGKDIEVYPYISRISPFTDECEHVLKTQSDISEFFDLQYEFIQKLNSFGIPVKYAPLYHFPQPRLCSCSAVGDSGFVIDPQGNLYKCGLTYDDENQSMGRVEDPIDTQGTNYKPWIEYSPFNDKVCVDCEFLPSCYGGCPRDKIFRRELQEKETCEYYKRFENQLLAFHIGLDD